MVAKGAEAAKACELMLTSLNAINS
jgi:hypothetical protein